MSHPIRPWDLLYCSDQVEVAFCVGIFTGMAIMAAGFLIWGRRTRMSHDLRCAHCERPFEACVCGGDYEMAYRPRPGVFKQEGISPGAGLLGVMAFFGWVWIALALFWTWRLL